VQKQNHKAIPVTTDFFNSLLGTAMSLRFALYALYALSVNLALVFGCLCAIYFLERDCGAAWKYYGCKAPTNIDQPALLE
jgi:hypothetical protein